MWAAVTVRIRSCCCTRSCCPRSSFSSRWSRSGAPERVGLLGRGAQAGVCTKYPQWRRTHPPASLLRLGLGHSPSRTDTHQVSPRPHPEKRHLWHIKNSWELGLTFFGSWWLGKRSPRRPPRLVCKQGPERRRDWGRNCRRMEMKGNNEGLSRLESIGEIAHSPYLFKDEETES